MQAVRVPNNRSSLWQTVRQAVNELHFLVPAPHLYRITLLFSFMNQFLAIFFCFKLWAVFICFSPTPLTACCTTNCTINSEPIEVVAYAPTRVYTKRRSKAFWPTAVHYATLLLYQYWYQKETRNLRKAHETRESLQHFQFSSYSFENRISLGLGPSGP